MGVKKHLFWKRYKKNCRYCNKIIRVVPSYVKRAKFCSYSCRSQYLVKQKWFIKKLSISHLGQVPWYKNKHIQTNTGRTHFKKGMKPWSKGLTIVQMMGNKKNKERIIKLSKTLKLQYNNGRIGYWKGKKFSDKTKLKMSKSQKGKKLGKNNPAWNGGKGCLYGWFFRIIRPKIRERDNYTCQLCFTKKDLNVHHINYNKKHNTLKNLITLCRGCNSFVNTNRDKWKRYFRTGVLND